jgi:uncharacterized protein involved in exopolysaccharide biosynthesis
MQSDSGILLNSVRDIFYVIFRHKWSILFFFVLVTAIVTAVTFVLPKGYESTAKLILRIGQESMPSDPGVTNALLNVNQERTGEVKSAMAILTSYDLAASVVEHVGPGWILNKPALRRNQELPIDEPGSANLIQLVSGMLSTTYREALIMAQLKERLTPEEEAIQTLRENLQVTSEERTSVVDVSLMLENAQVSQVVLNTLISQYLEKHVKVFASTVSPVFYEEKAQERHEELAKAEAALAEFRAMHEISSIPAQTETLLAQLSELEGQLSTVRAEADGLEAMVGQLQRAMDAQGRTHEVSRTVGMPNYAADALKERLIELRTQEKDLSLRYPDSHRPLIELREKIETVQTMLANEPETLTEVTTGLNANYESFAHTYQRELANLNGSRASIAGLEREQAELRDRINKIAAQEVTYERLMRERDTLEQEYKDVRETWNRAQLDQAKTLDNISNVSVAQMASFPLQPAKPNKMRNISFGLLLGLFGGIVLAFVKEYLDDTLNTVEAAEKRLGVPVLAEISEKEFRKCT